MAFLCSSGRYLVSASLVSYRWLSPSKTGKPRLPSSWVGTGRILLGLRRQRNGKGARAESFAPRTHVPAHGGTLRNMITVSRPADKGFGPLATRFFRALRRPSAAGAGHEAQIPKGVSPLRAAFSRRRLPTASRIGTASAGTSVSSVRNSGRDSTSRLVSVTVVAP